MAESANGPTRYRVVYSEYVREQTRNLVLRARAVGLGAQVMAAIEEINSRLRVYPQFGQPLRDLVLESAQVWIGVVEPLVVQYVLDEARKLVMVPVPFRSLPNTGL